MGAIAQVSYLLCLLLALPTAGFLIRVFIIFHDAGHGAFFRRSRWNRVIGYLAGILTITPFRNWTYEHARHHATASDLDRRDLGAIWTMTVNEFVAAPRRRRLAYRVFRNPFVLFFLLAPVAFLFTHRIPRRGMSNRAKWALIWSNVGMALFVVAMSWPFGFTSFVLVFTPVATLASTFGTWLFYVQHQFEGAYWSRHESWDFARAALAGSSYLALPRVLQWFTGNIGFHHVHHLDPRIPNYHLERAHRAHPLLREVPALRLRDTLHCLSVRLYDEATRQMVSFREGLRRARLAPTAG
jgi:omega-6 fatty acid desaturase (delta-12 desaturase)